ncbi:MAG: hypothetical protein IID42_01810, partial [Planctomycetes bacterium]|nr:hypothetical protein [Planctomycetota bacterium]
MPARTAQHGRIAGFEAARRVVVKRAMAKRQRGHALRKVGRSMPAPSAWAVPLFERPPRRFENDGTLEHFTISYAGCTDVRNASNGERPRGRQARGSERGSGKRSCGISSEWNAVFSPAALIDAAALNDDTACTDVYASSLLKKSRSDEKVAAAPRGGRSTAIAVSKATSAAGGGRYAQFFNGLLG